METVDDLVARDRRSEATALSVAGGATYDYHRFLTTAWKTGNFLRHHGVREGATVAAADDRASQPLLTFLGTAMLGGVTRFVDPAESHDDAQAVVYPATDADAAEVPPGTNRIGYGDEPDDPAVAHFGRDVWSENPSFPPVERDPDSPVLAADGATYSHRDLLSAAEAVVEDHDLNAEDRVALRTPLAHPGTVVAGVVAPLLAGAAIVLPDADSPDADAAGTVAVTAGDAPEPRRIDPDDAAP
ncbi:acyl-CoA synthetase family protein [Halostella salina]|uniref:AMP-binding protein n=1 Tax=Halostella salina TaxID=1547897 RepID=UPI000EF82360|nr:AMP-binding protein [Halostella salina]